MTSKCSRWKTRELTETFLEGVRGAIPAASLQLEVLGKIVSMWCPAPSEVLDLGCGDGVLGRTLLDAHSTVHATFVDFSEPMLEAASKRIGNDRRTTVIKADFGTSHWIRLLEVGKRFDVIVSGFAIHHQADKRKRELYNEIYGLLREGGIFLNLEHVSSVTPPECRILVAYFNVEFTGSRILRRSDGVRDPVCVPVSLDAALIL